MSDPEVHGLLIDLQGVLHVDEQPVEGAAAAVRRLKKTGLPCRFLTNTTTRSAATLFADLEQMDLPVDFEEILTAPRACAAWLRREGWTRVRLIVREDTKEDFEGIEEVDVDPEAVVIGDIADRWDHALLQGIFDDLMAGARLVALHKGRYWQQEGGLVLDIGCYVAGLEYATGTEAAVVGKPAAAFFDAALESLGVAAEHALMVGDDVRSDVGGAQDRGIRGVLVRTGKFREEVLRRSGVAPWRVVDSIVDVPGLLGLD
jgi:HAD superfamily hydrolase (TIGR01458 family)